MNLKWKFIVFCGAAVVTFQASCPACSFGLPNLAYWVILRGRFPDTVVANLFWPVMAGFPSYYAGNHGGFPDWVQRAFACWGLVVPLATATGVTKIMEKLDRPTCLPRNKITYKVILLAYAASLMIYVPIPESLMGLGYAWMTY